MRGFGIGAVAALGVFGFVLFAVAQAGLIGSGSLLSTTTHLQPVPTDVFEHATLLHLEPPQTFDRACSLRGPGPVVRRLQDLAKARCPLPVSEVVPSAAQPKVLGANLVGLRPPSFAVPPPKPVAWPPLAWVVFFSGRQALGDYFTTIYDAYTGEPW